MPRGSVLALLLVATMSAAACAEHTYSDVRPAPPAEDEVARPGRPGWSVDSRTGCLVWNPYPQQRETVSWSGGCDRNGRAFGSGVVEWRYGDRLGRYHGDYRDGKPNGRGTYTSANGNRYEGEYRNGLRHGRGVYTYANGGRYEGEYRDGKPHGFGTFTRGRATYSGRWVNGCFRHAGQWAYVNTAAQACGFILARPVSLTTLPGRGGIEGNALSLDPSNERGKAFLEEVRRRIHANWSYPCVANPGTEQCDYLNAEVMLEFGILVSGQLQFVDVVRSSRLAIYDDSAIAAVKLASPYPEVPDEVMAVTKPGSAGVLIAARLRYIAQPSPMQDAPIAIPAPAAKP
jgi:TonB family protein